MPSFVHLHAHSEFSLLDGYARVDRLVAEAKAQGAPALALTDHGVMYAGIDFYRACKDAGVKPILGVEAYVAPNSRTDRRPKVDQSPYHLVLLARNRKGYRNLIQLTTKAHVEGFYYKPRVDRELLEKHADGLICLSACLAAEVPRLVRAGDMGAAREAAAWHRDVFGKDNYFLELQEHDMPEQTEANKGVVQIARDLGVPLVATNDVHYVTAEEMRGQDLLLCIQTNSTVDDANRMRMGTNTFFLRSPEEMAALFAEHPDALASTLTIAEMCDLKLDFERLHLPDVEVPEGHTVESYLEELCRQGLKRRLPNAGPEYEERLRYELEVVKQTGFSQYILILWDIVAYARQQGIICGPRGSAAGALVLYLIGISDVDPVKHKLTFERFLNPERVEPPDVDMDFPDDRRDEMIEYVARKYGRDHVAQIVTFGTLGAKAAIRDTGRVLGLSYGEVDRVAKLVPPLPLGITIDGAIQANPLLKQLVDEDDSVKKLVDDAKRVEGFARHASTHAAGVVISREPLVEYTPLQPTARDSSSLMTQYHADNLMKIGLLKMDLLGLSNLTILGRAVEIIKRERGEDIDLLALPPEDPKAFELLGKGETVGLFQLEGRGMTGYLRELRPTSIDDITAMIALYRPGPMANIPQYIARKHGHEAVTYPHPLLKDVLEDTYGVLTYQDQVLQVLRKVAGYSLGQADIVRKAMGKKIRELMEKERVRFAEGCKQNGVSDEDCEELWNLLEPFSGYGFNRAHAACYAQIAYQTAYLKANYPVEFMTAVLSTFRDAADRVTRAVVECRRMGIEILPPDVNASEWDFSIESGRIRYGLAAVKNVGEGAAKLIIEARPFASVEDFFRRVDLKAINKRVLESLIKAGAFDGFGCARSQLLVALERLIGLAQRDLRAAEVGQASMFDLMPRQEVAFVLPDVPEAPDQERLAWEKELLGVYFSEHPMTQVTAALERVISCYCAEVNEEFVGQRVTIAGVVSGLRPIITKRREAMCTAMLEDAHGAAEVVAFPRTYEATRDLWKEGAALIVEGKVEQREERFQVVVDSARPVEEKSAEEEAPVAGDALPRMVVGPQSRDAAAATNGNGNGKHANGYRANGNGNGNGRHANGNGHNGNGNGHAAPAPVVDRPGTRQVLTLPRSGDPEADARLLGQLLDALGTAEPGPDEVVVRVGDGPDAFELFNPDLRVLFGVKLSRAVKLLLPEGVPSVS